MAVVKRRFGNTDVMVSEIGFGCGGFWGMRSFPDKQAAELVDIALEHGVNLLDTGPNYSGGNAEPRLGAILAGRRDQVFVATKVGSKLVGSRVVKDWSASAIRASIEGSLKSLRTDHVDLVELHSPSADVLEDEGVLGALAAIKKEGLSTYVGLSTDSTNATRAIEMGGFDCVMLTWNVLHHAASRRVAELGARAGVAVLARSPMAHKVYEPALFRPTTRAGVWYLLRALKNFRGDVNKARSLKFLHQVEGWKAPQVALRFVLENPHLTAAMIGTTNPHHLVDNLAISGGPSLPPDVVERILRIDP